MKSKPSSVRSRCVLVVWALLGWLALTGTVRAAAEGEDQATVFAGTIAQSIAAGIVFLILLTVLWKWAWGPILKGLVDREDRIKQDLQRAEEAAKKAEATLAQYQRELATADQEACRIIDQGKADAQKIAAQLKEITQKEIDQIRLRAETEITHAKVQALGEISSRAAELATQVAGRVLGRQINPADHRQLIEDSLAQMTRQTH